MHLGLSFMPSVILSGRQHQRPLFLEPHGIGEDASQTLVWV
jgi:hypothetical protein